MNKELKEIVNHQAEMESLWATPIYRLPTLHESVLLAALRHLHAVIEGDDVTAQISKKGYWDMDSEL